MVILAGVTAQNNQSLPYLELKLFILFEIDDYQVLATFGVSVEEHPVGKRHPALVHQPDPKALSGGDGFISERKFKARRPILKGGAG